MDLGDVGGRLIGLDPKWLIGALGLLLVQTAISSLKWKMILESDGVELGFIYLFRVYLVGGFLSLFLPTSFGGDVYKAYSVGRDQGNLGKVASSVLFDRVSGLFALTTIALIGYVLLPDQQYAVLITVVYLTGLGGFFLATSNLTLRYLDNIRDKFDSKRLWKIVVTPLRSFRIYRRNYRMLARALLISFVFQLGHVVISKIYCISLGIDISFGLLLAVIPIIFLTDVLPIAINGIGVRDSAFVLFFVLLGFPKEDGLAIALLLLFMQYVYNLVGGTIFLTDSLKTRASA